MLGLRLSTRTVTAFPCRFFASSKANKNKFKTPKLRLKNVNPILPPPGFGLELPEWTPTEYFRRIGGDCEEFGENFESLSEVFSEDRK